MSHSSHTAKPELSKLFKKLFKVADKWENIGILLGIDSDKLNAVRKVENSSSQDCLREMLKLYLKQVKPPPTWSAVADVLETVGEEELAGNLRNP